MERGIHRLSASEAAGWQSAGKATFPHKGSRGRARLVAVGIGVAALACAGALAATQLSGSPGTARRAPGHRAPAPVVLTAAMVRRVASASRLALAHSGRVVVYSRETTDGALRNTSTDVITFSGKNWNDSSSEVLPGIDGGPASTQSAVDRVVDGRAYDYFVATDGRRWYHVTGPDAVASLNIPDPRKLLAELAPAARFVVAGKAVLGGVAVTKLEATDPAALPPMPGVPIWPAGTVTTATAWVDASGVVRQLGVTATQTVHGVTGPVSEKLRKLLREVSAREHRLVNVGHVSLAEAARIVAATPLGREIRKAGIQLITDTTTETVSFTDIGRPQVIKVPAGAVTISAVG
jgi:hypothetical protein